MIQMIVACMSQCDIHFTMLIRYSKHNCDINKQFYTINHNIHRISNVKTSRNCGIKYA